MTDCCYQAPLRTTPNTKHHHSNFTAVSVLEEVRGHWFEILSQKDRKRVMPTETGFDINYVLLMGVGHDCE